MSNDSSSTPPALVLAHLHGPDGARWVLARVEVPIGTNLVVFRKRHYYRARDYDFYECEPVFEVVEDEQPAT